MKTFLITILSCGLLFSAGRLQSQMTTENVSPASIMSAMKASNAETLAKQAATLVVLEQLVQDANQIKIFAKRG